MVKENCPKCGRKIGGEQHKLAEDENDTIVGPEENSGENTIGENAPGITESDVNKFLGDPACEVTKETFFKSLYNPAEKISSKIYKIRANYINYKGYESDNNAEFQEN